MELNLFNVNFNTLNLPLSKLVSVRMCSAPSLCVSNVTYCILVTFK